MKNLEAHFKEIKKQYPKTMSKDQLYRVAHISKATALYLLQSGAIPCKDTGKKTRRYTIKTDDVIEYLRQREICPEKYKASEGWYAGTAGAKKAIAPSCWITLTPEQTKKFELFFEAEMKEMADLIMVAGHLREKKGYFYAVLNYTDAHGNRKTKWIATGLAVKGNKKRAEAFLQEQRRSFQEDVPITGDVLFADFMEQWLTVIKSSVAVTTFASYSNMVKKVIVPYFRERQIALQELSAKHIQDFYLKELERVSASSVIHYHANIHKALKYAVKLDLISSNPADKIERPKKERFMANFYDADEVNRLFEISKGTKLEIPILFGAFYGMRRSETLGMKWDAIDFERDTITIRHTLTTVALDGKRITVAEDRTKNKSSMRTLPLVPFVKERLLELKAEQEENRRLCGRSYVKDYTGYVCINEIGDIIKPNYVSCGFPKLLEEHGLRRVRYHDLRHSCASLLLANGVPMKQIQEWLGHSDFSTTANIYAHLEYSSKVISADAMLAGLGIGNRE